MSVLSQPFTSHRCVVIVKRYEIVKAGRHLIQALCLLGTLLFAVRAVAQAQTYTNSYGVWYYTENGNGTCVITNYTGSGGAVAIPGMINSLNVMIIGNGLNAVFPNSGLTSVTIPSGVTAIETNAFAFCSSLTEVSIPSSVMNIGDDAFEYCSALTSVAIPGNVTSVGNSVFEGCYALTSVTMENNVSQIGEDAFGDCYDLTSLVIPDSVTNIGGAAFAGCGLTSVTIPNSVTSIGNGVFEDCVSLTSVTMSTNITSIGADTFAGYPSGDPLTSFIIPNRVTNIGINAFQYCTALTSIIIPDSVTNIGQGAFQYCDSLANATIGDNVTTIGDFAFEFSGLTNVTIPAGVTNIGNVAFACCLDMTAITVDTQNAFYSSVGGALMDKGQTTLIQFPSGLAGAYAIPDGLTTIGAYSFYGSALSSLTIPNSVTTIEGAAFYICGNLSSITIGSGVTNLAGGAFYYCTSIPFNLYFQGNAPGGGYDPFYGENFASMTVYYLFGTSGWQYTFWGVPAVMLNAPTNGSLQVIISPAGAVTAGAEWQVDGGVFQTSGSIVTNLSVGNHTVSFTMISGWTTPSNQIISVSANMTATANGIYVLPAPPQVTTTELPNATNALAYSQQLSALNGQLPYTWSIYSGSLPFGLALATNGMISGMPTHNGTFNFTVEVTDALSETATQALQLNVVAPPAAAIPVLLSAPYSGSSFYGMYSPDATAAAFTLTNSYYVSTIDVTLYTPGTNFNTYHFTVQNSLTNPLTLFASQNLTAAAGVSTQVMNVNMTLPAGTYYLTGIVPGYFGTTITPGDVDGWFMSTGNYDQTGGTIENGVWADSNPPTFSTGGVYVAPAFTVNTAIQLGMNSVQPINSNGFDLVLYSVPGLNYDIETSTNLVDWTVITNFVSTNSPFYLNLPITTTVKQQFYRAVLP